MSKKFDLPTASIISMVGDCGCKGACDNELKSLCGGCPELTLGISGKLRVGFFCSITGDPVDPAEDLVRILLAIKRPFGSEVVGYVPRDQFSTVASIGSYRCGDDYHAEFTLDEDCLGPSAYLAADQCAPEACTPRKVKTCFSLTGELPNGDLIPLGNGKLSLCYNPLMIKITENGCKCDKACKLVTADQNYVDIPIPAGFAYSDIDGSASIDRIAAGSENLLPGSVENNGTTARQYLSAEPENSGTHNVCLTFSKE